MNRSVSLVRAAALAALVLFTFAGALRAADTRDPKAEEVARAMMQAMGGEQAWKSAHFVRYDFKVTRDGKPLTERSHLWDKWSGRYRLEMKTKEGKNQVLLYTDVNQKQGSAYLDGKKLEGDEAAKALENGYKAFINDMYWLAMPWKWMDSGVNLKYVGPKKCGKETYDVVELTFGNVGVTPGDKYEAYVSRDSHMMMHWEYTLQSKDKGAWDWRYADAKGVKLASDHTNDQKMSINMGDVRVLDLVDSAFFADPNHALAQMK